MLQELVKDPAARDKMVENYMQPPFPIVQASDPIDTIAKRLAEHKGAVLVDLGQGKYHIITRHDVVAVMS